MKQLYMYKEAIMNTVVNIENLVKRYKELLALDHLNLSINEGEIFGLLGPNGSGKTTTINCLLSLLSYDKGTIEIFGQPMSPDNYDIKRQIGVVIGRAGSWAAGNSSAVDSFYAHTAPGISGRA